MKNWRSLRKNDDKNKEINSLKNIINECEDFRRNLKKKEIRPNDFIKIKDAEIEKEQQLNNFKIPKVTRLIQMIYLKK